MEREVIREPAPNNEKERYFSPLPAKLIENFVSLQEKLYFLAILKFAEEDASLHEADKNKFLNRLYECFERVLKSTQFDPLKKLKKLKELRGIAIAGTYKGHVIRDTDPRQRGKKEDRLDLRGALSLIYAQNEALADEIVFGNVIGAHASTSGSIIGVLNHGIRPQKFLKENEILAATGEVIFEGEGINQECVSFTNWNNGPTLALYAGDYSGKQDVNDIGQKINNIAQASCNAKPLYKKSAELYIKQKNAVIDYLRNAPPGDVLGRFIQENFPVIYLVSDDSFKDFEGIQLTGNKELGDFMVRGGVPTCDIKIMLVPRIKVKEVSELARSTSVKVFPIEDFFTFYRLGTVKEKGLYEFE